MRPVLHPKVEDAMRELAECVAARFTGTLSFDFKEGVPMVRKRLDTRHLGKPGKGGA